MNLISQNADSCFYKGKKEFETGNYTKALENFKKTLPQDPHFQNIFYYCGLTTFNLKNYEEAILYFKKEMDIYPKHVSAYLFSAKSKEAIGENPSALNDLETALKIDSVNVLLLLEKSAIYFNEKNYEKSKINYLKVLKFNSNLDLVYFKLGFCEYYLKRKSEACNYWNKIEDIDDFENYETALNICNSSHKKK